MRIPLLITFLFFMNNIHAQNEKAQITNLSATFDDNNQILSINYDLFDAEQDLIRLMFFVSNDGGESYTIDTENAIGDVGSSISPGSNKNILWDASGKLTGEGEYFVKLLADDLYEVNIQEIVDQVDSSRLRSDLEFIEGIRHHIANPEHLESIKDSIEQRFLAADLFTYRQDFPFGNYMGQNIIGRMEGSYHADSTYIIDGHFDTVSESPGADDNGSAVAGLLEALRVLSPYQFDKTIRFISFDLEEVGLEGSFAYTENGILPSETIKGVFNMEMIAYYSEEENSQTLPIGFGILYPDVLAELSADQFRGNFITNIGVQNAIPLQNAYTQAADKYVPDLKVVSLVAPDAWQSLTPDFGRSDHAPFWLENIPALMLTDGSNFRNPNYHTANDLINTLDFTFMTNVVKAVVAAVAEEAGVNHSTPAYTEFFSTSSIKDALDCDLLVSPMPAQNKLELDLGDCFNAELIIQIYANSGQLVYSKETITEHNVHINLDLSKLEKGIYLLQLSDGKRKINRRIILN